MATNALSPEQIQQMIQFLQNMLPNNDVAESKDTKTDDKIINKFEQMQEFSMHKEDCEIDKKLSKFPPSPRTRQFVPISVVCMICGRSEQVNPSLVDSPDRYKCNRCCTR